MKCPYCGAETTSRKCEYCNSDLSEQYMNNGTIGGAVSGAINNIGQSIANNINNMSDGTNRNNEFQKNQQPEFVQNIITDGQARYTVRTDVSPKHKNVALLLCILGFAGVGGLHRFYTGHILSGILWVLTGGMFYIGTIIDLISILSNKFKDKNGLKLLSEGNI